jgi:hypothetical protein
MGGYLMKLQMCEKSKLITLSNNILGFNRAKLLV